MQRYGVTAFDVTQNDSPGTIINPIIAYVLPFSYLGHDFYDIEVKPNV